MRFTKIPLIATLMAVALSLLIVLPTLAQVSGDRTDGRLSVGDWVDVRVADNLDDIESDATAVRTSGKAYAVNTATGTDPANDFQAQDTYFNGDLYISNATDAFNTILISAAVPDNDRIDADDGDDANGEETCASGVTAAVATIKNDRSGARVTAYLVDSGDDEEDGTNRSIYQGIVAVWDQEDAIEAHSAVCDAQNSNADHGDPVKWYAFGEDPDPDDIDAEEGYFVDDDDSDTADDREDGWTAASAAVIPARDGDTITITVDGVSGSIRLIVDGDEPEIEDVTPASGGTQSSTTVNLGFTVGDDGSGIRYDGESGASGDPDLAPQNGDGDQRFDEPLTMAGPDTNNDGTPDSAGDGSTQDIEVNFGTAADAMTDVSQYGSNDWTQRVKGVAYDLDMRLVGKEFGKYYWQITAMDRVGNMAVTDSDEDTSGDQPFSFTVDDADPEVNLARTGIGYEAGEGEFKDRSWIALNFVNHVKGGADRIDASTVAAGDFTVEGHTVMSALVPTDKKVCKGDDPRTPKDEEDESAKNITAFDADNGGNEVLVEAVAADANADPPVTAVVEVRSDVAENCDFEPRARVYLELADELASDETPTIQILGGVLQDIAGNNNVTQSLENVQDKIAPGISITITSSSGTTGRTATDDEGEFTVRVTSDEDLRSFPRLFFATIEGVAEVDEDDVGVGGKASGLTIALVTGSTGLSLTEKESNVWEKTFDDEDIEGSGDRIVAVIITATDDTDLPGNSGNSAGWKGSGTPGGGDGLDFKKLDAGGFLLEIDSNLEPAMVEVLPSTNPGPVTDATESMNPYIQITFSEPNEYGIAVTEPDDDDDTTTEATGVSKSIDIGDGKTAKTDSHTGVAITALTLNGEDRLAEVVQVDPWKYVLAVTGLAIGDYEIVYSATDDVGNEVEDEDSEFKVLERQPYEIVLQPGWNLISFPGDPFNPAVGSVVGSDLRADTVLGYQSGEWVTAVKNEDGRWQGTLTDIVGGYGYWIRTTAVETVETVIPPNLPTSVLPTVPVISGWNLLGVVDADQTKIGAETGATQDADEYFTSLNVWRVAYGFETQQNRWSKLLPDGQDADALPHEVANGKGYWVWSTRPGTLVP